MADYLKGCRTEDHLENNWSGKRRQSLASMLAILAQDSDSGIIDYGDTGVLHKNQNASHFSQVF